MRHLRYKLFLKTQVLLFIFIMLDFHAWYTEIQRFSFRLSFKDLFSSLILANPTLSPVEKLQYLKISVVGSAFHLLKNTALTADNFQKSWEALISFYENKRLLVNAALHSLLSLKHGRIIHGLRMLVVLPANRTWPTFRKRARIEGLISPLSFVCCARIHSSFSRYLWFTVSGVEICHRKNLYYFVLLLYFIPYLH